jgi:hypothetical protein
LDRKLLERGQLVSICNFLELRQPANGGGEAER